jgi:hypothetical protein
MHENFHIRGNSESATSRIGFIHFSRFRRNLIMNSRKRPVESIDSDDDNLRIILNVGGKRFETHRSTLIQAFPESLLSAMFARRNKQLVKPDDDGSYFFDRSSSIFKHILDCYRNVTTPRLDEPPKDSGISSQAWNAELLFWGLAIAPVSETRLTVLDQRDITLKQHYTRLCTLLAQEMREYWINRGVGADPEKPELELWLCTGEIFVGNLHFLTPVPPDDMTGLDRKLYQTPHMWSDVLVWPFVVSMAPGSGDEHNIQLATEPPKEGSLNAHILQCWQKLGVDIKPVCSFRSEGKRLHKTDEHGYYPQSLWKYRRPLKVTKQDRWFDFDFVNLMVTFK